MDAPVLVIRAQIRYTEGVALLGTKNGVNRAFTSPETFRDDDLTTVRVFHNGRRLIKAPDDSPRNGDFYVSESVPGGGYDTVNLLTFAPVASSELRADYVPG
jgi:hypothetical protein